MNKTLYFQDETNYYLNADVSNISTTFRNDLEEKIYVKLHRGREKYLRKISKSGNKLLKNPVTEVMDDAIICYFCSKVLKGEEDDDETISFDCEKKPTGKKFTEENILQFINHNCNCSFDYICILPKDSGYKSCSIDDCDRVIFNLMEDCEHEKKSYQLSNY